MPNVLKGKKSPHIFQTVSQHFGTGLCQNTLEFSQILFPGFIDSSHSPFPSSSIKQCLGEKNFSSKADVQNHLLLFFTSHLSLQPSLFLYFPEITVEKIRNCDPWWDSRLKVTSTNLQGYQKKYSKVSGTSALNRSYALRTSGERQWWLKLGKMKEGWAEWSNSECILERAKGTS